MISTQNEIAPPAKPDITAHLLDFLANLAPAQLDGLDLHGDRYDFEYWFESNYPEVLESHWQAWGGRIDWRRVREVLRDRLMEV